MRRRLAHWGKERMRQGFLWWPKEIGNDWRWLEDARWVEECRKGAFTGKRFWLPLRWLDHGEELEDE